MKTRLLTAAVAVPLLLVVLFVLPTWVLAWIVAVFSAIGVYELLYRTGCDEYAYHIHQSAATKYIMDYC